MKLTLSAGIQKFKGSHLLDHHETPLADYDLNLALLNLSKGSVEFDGWMINYECHTLKNEQPGLDWNISFIRVNKDVSETSVSVEFDFSQWSVENYIHMPSALYAGNRFRSLKVHYAPIFTDSEDQRLDIPTTITDIPRLEIGAGPSSVQLMSRDLATPAFGFYNPQNNKSFHFFSKNGNMNGDFGYTLTETDDRSKLRFTLRSPGVRIQNRYMMCDTSALSHDSGATFIAGERIDFKFQTYTANCFSIPEYFRQFFSLRKVMCIPSPYLQRLPYSAACDLIEEKYNQTNWREDYEYYACGVTWSQPGDENRYGDWQAGWVGGMIVTYPLLIEGNNLSATRAKKNFDFFFKRGLTQNGLVHAGIRNGVPYGDHFRDTTLPWLLIRKQGDVLYYVLKQLFWLRDKMNSNDIPAVWMSGIRKMADALVQIWKTNGQFGQFVDSQTGKIIVGNSTCGAIIPAGLALAARFFDEPEYLHVACASARSFGQQFTQRGYTTGGPGEVLQCPDSESSYALLESFVTLFEETGEKEWLEYAEDAAAQFSSWVVSYDYPFPEGSLFHKLRIQSTGAFWANVQNKHAAPGICTYSGLALFKLWRMTNNAAYLELLKDIVHCLPQCVSYPGNEIGQMPTGWISERINLSDWEDMIGNVYEGSCWPEVSALLTYLEIPGIHVIYDRAEIHVFDHVEACIIDHSDKEFSAEISNPTEFSARVKIFCESSDSMTKPLRHSYPEFSRIIKIASHQKQTLRFHRITGDII